MRNGKNKESLEVVSIYTYNNKSAGEKNEGIVKGKI